MIFNNNSQNNPQQFHSIIAIGNPIIDIVANINKETINKFGLKWGETVFTNQINKPFFQEIQKESEVTFTPGGAIQNTLRIMAWCISQDPNTSINDYKLTMLGSVGDDINKDKIINSLKLSNIKPLFEIIPNTKTSRCAVGIYNKERCLLSDIIASNYLSENFISQHLDEIDSHDILLIEGYFLKEKFELCRKLCERFRQLNKYIVLTLCDPVITEFHNEQIIEIANNADMVVGNFGAAQILAGKKGTFSETFLEIHKKFLQRDRLLVITAGSQGVLCSKFDYINNRMEFILQKFPPRIAPNEIVDLNGAGDAFLGGFLSQKIQGKHVDKCCTIGNEVANIVLRNVGCYIIDDVEIDFSER